MKAACEKIGLIPVSAHVGIDDLKKDGVLEDYAAIGCRYVAVPWLDEERRPGGEKYAAFCADVKAVAAKADTLGITLMYHNHDFEFKKCGDEYLLDRMYRDLPVLCAQLDTCWVRVGGEDPAAYVEKYSGRVPVVHLKDYCGGAAKGMYQLIGVDDDKPQEAVEAFSFRPVGQGVQDFPAILAAAEKSGTEWVVVEQDMPTPGKTALECVAESVAYLRSL
jgi:sugar phosphate isomerase/epimerase